MNRSINSYLKITWIASGNCVGLSTLTCCWGSTGCWCNWGIISGIPGWWWGYWGCLETPKLCWMGWWATNGGWDCSWPVISGKLLGIGGLNPCCCCNGWGVLGCECLGVGISPGPDIPEAGEKLLWKGGMLLGVTGMCTPPCCCTPLIWWTHWWGGSVAWGWLCWCCTGWCLGVGWVSCCGCRGGVRSFGPSSSCKQVQLVQLVPEIHF